MATAGGRFEMLASLSKYFVSQLTLYVTGKTDYGL
jgi:hypothetical protein